MSDSHSNPLSLKNLLAGIIVTVTGGVILAYLLQDARFSREEPQIIPVTEAYNQSGRQVSEPIIIPSPTEDTACQGAPKKRLKVGSNAIVCTAGETVSLRSGPRRSASAVDHLSPGTRLVVIGEAICDESVPWWYWEVKTDRGYTGWVSEGGDEVDPYFVCPVN